MQVGRKDYYYGGYAAEGDFVWNLTRSGSNSQIKKKKTLYLSLQLSYLQSREKKVVL